MSSYDSKQSTGLITLHVTNEQYAYLEALIKNGLLIGEVGDHQPLPKVKRMMQAVHHHLAGGEVSLDIQERGTRKIVNDLNAMMVSANESTGNSTKLSYAITDRAYAYLKMLGGNGMFTYNSQGEPEGISSEIASFAEAMHTVLAGGDVRVSIESRGPRSITQDLDDGLEAAIDAANAINTAAGYYITAIP